LLLVGLCSCGWIANGFKVGPNYDRPQAAVQADWIDYQNPNLMRTEVDLSQWWTVFQDPILDRLIAEAWQQNLGLKASLARVAEAAAQLLGLERRPVFRLLKAYRAEGATGLISKRRGRPSNRRKPEELRDKALAIIRERYWDFGPTLAAEKLREGGKRVVPFFLRRPVVQRKIGPGQYVSYTSTGIVDPVFTIGDLSTVWLVAYVRESEAPKVRAGQQLDFTVLAYPKTTFKANIDHVAASLDPSIRRLLVRATIDNSNGQFKPEMFTSVTIYTDEGDSSIGVPRDAVIYEADNARVWVARADKTIEVRQIKTGITRGGQIQVLQGLQPGEIVVTKGSLFVDQAAGS
jgi:multidrug efflux pump subunit AcrA (membrane-fusion protein)